MKKKKIPMRMCVGCRESKPKQELIRVVRSPEGEIHIDLKGKAPGRGAYLCYNIECLEKAIKHKSLERALDEKISEEVYQSLRGELSKVHESES
ncbi:RNase P modulator RnpM [Caldicoprobacter algeriensis]|uniref:RNase P modulator RnpM n=1 Tax=Caldicoprobacter algeriensis TaxID=699281 RepID=UPI0030B826E2